jgi:PPOX class probable F420-dependent enzyme
MPDQRDSPRDPALWQLVFDGQQGVLATIAHDGLPQLTNILYVGDRETRTVRISTTADRVKYRNLTRDPRAVLHVAGDNFWAFAVASGPVSLSAVAAEPGDEACRELLSLHSSFYDDLHPDAFYAEMIANRRVVMRLGVERVTGIIATTGRRPETSSDNETVEK